MRLRRVRVPRSHCSADASQAGHGGGEFFILEDFARAVRTGVSPIDVYDAVTWSSIMPLSAESFARGGAPVAIPDFRRGRVGQQSTAQSQ